ncbi:7586_t:CDS:2, partial [Funneliformis geosporum]
QTFRILQSVHEPVRVADHDFPAGYGTLQLTIFVCRQWSLGTSLLTHMQDLESLILDPQYDDTLKADRETRPIWILL